MRTSLQHPFASALCSSDRFLKGPDISIKVLTNSTRTNINISMKLIAGFYPLPSPTLVRAQVAGEQIEDTFCWSSVSCTWDVFQILQLSQSNQCPRRKSKWHVYVRIKNSWINTVGNGKRDFGLRKICFFPRSSVLYFFVRKALWEKMREIGVFF